MFEYAPGRAVPLPDGSPTSFEVRSRQTKRHRARLGVERRVFSELVGREAEMEPPRLESGEVPADLLALPKIAAEARVNT